MARCGDGLRPGKIRILAAITPVGLEARQIDVCPIGIFSLRLEPQQIDHDEWAIFRRFEKGLGLLGGEVKLIFELHVRLLF